MHALADCVPVRRAIKDLRLYAISFYLSVSCLCAGHSILATFRVCYTHVVFLIFECAVLITSCKLRLTAWDVGSSKYFWQVSWVVEVDVERRGGSILKNIQHGLLRWFLQTVQENSSWLRGLQNITTCSAFVDQMVLPAAPWRRRWWSVVRLMKSACAAGYKNVWHRSTSLLQRKDYLFLLQNI